MWIWMTTGNSVSCVDIFAEFELLKDIEGSITTGASYDSSNLGGVSMAQTMALGVFWFLAFL